MNNTSDVLDDDDLLPEYELDYSKGVRGKYYERAMRAKRFVEIDADVLAVFPNTIEINAALRGLIEVARRVAPRSVAPH